MAEPPDATTKLELPTVKTALSELTVPTRPEPPLLETVNEPEDELDVFTSPKARDDDETAATGFGST